MGKKGVKFSTIGTVEKLLKSWKLFQMLKCWKIVENLLKDFLLKTVESLWKSWNVERLLKTCWKLFQLFNFSTLLLKTHLWKSWKVGGKMFFCRSFLNKTFNIVFNTCWKSVENFFSPEFSTAFNSTFQQFQQLFSGWTNFHSKKNDISVTIFVENFLPKLRKWRIINQNKFSTAQKRLQS